MQMKGLPGPCVTLTDMIAIFAQKTGRNAGAVQRQEEYPDY